MVSPTNTAGHSTLTFIPGSSWVNLGIIGSPCENSSLACSRQLPQASWISCSASTSSPTLSRTFSAAFWKNFVYLLKTVWISSLMLCCRTARRRSVEMEGYVKLVVICKRQPLCCTCRGFIVMFQGFVRTTCPAVLASPSLRLPHSAPPGSQGCLA